MVETIQVTNTSGNLSSTQIFNSTSSIGYQPIVIEASNAAGKTSVSCDWYGTLPIATTSQTYIDKINNVIIDLCQPDINSFITAEIAGGELLLWLSQNAGTQTLLQYLVTINQIEQDMVGPLTNAISLIHDNLMDVLQSIAQTIWLNDPPTPLIISYSWYRIEEMYLNNTAGNLTVNVNGIEYSVYYPGPSA